MSKNNNNHPKNRTERVFIEAIEQLVEDANGRCVSITAQIVRKTLLDLHPNNAQITSNKIANILQTYMDEKFREKYKVIQQRRSKRYLVQIPISNS
ncbi:MAG: hypothetical protein GF364_15190 [Candidatus Lokiarchaeota archaeon]|nr:hypothetical protein [Candidatus Lokiarchaeota archaeon]